MSTNGMGAAEVGGAGLLLWLSFLTGPAAWGIRLSGSYAVVAVACDWDLVGPLVLGLTGAEWLVLLLTTVTAVACLAAGVAGWVVWRRSGAGWGLGDNGRGARNGFLGLSGFLMNMFFLAVILLEGSAVFFLGVCD